jgi:hypothetical protein
MTKLTASEAKSLTDQQYNKSKEYTIQEKLDKIYSKIGDASRKGSYRIELDYPNYGDEISSILKKDGYKVKKRVESSFRDFDEFLVISWEN